MAIPPPHSNFTRAILTDMYQITMTYAHFHANKHEQNCVFDYFFRKHPFKGQYTMFGGLSEVISFLNSYKFSDQDIEYLRKHPQLSDAGEDFFTYLGSLDCSKLKVHGVKEGNLVFPREPLIRIEGPLGIAQLLETTILNMINYATLVTTYAARIRVAAGESAILLEMGLRRAQGPDGAMSASRYSYIGGFDGTSNVLAGINFGIKVSGTHAHAYVQSYEGLEDLSRKDIKKPDGGTHADFLSLVLDFRKRLGAEHTNSGELAAFISYCQAFPKGFLALVDTYDTLKSGVPNFLACALALHQLGYTPLGIRLDSGDLGSLSQAVRQQFRKAAADFSIPSFADLGIVASNDLNELALYELAAGGHAITAFGIGTALATCEAQPALGGVCKLVEIGGKPRIKLSQARVSSLSPLPLH
jgi:nicotinate phosphoribosyltransferase